MRRVASVSKPPPIGPALIDAVGRAERLDNSPADVRRSYQAGSAPACQATAHRTASSPNAGQRARGWTLGPCALGLYSDAAA